ncbi:MAG: hypothetical protein AAFN18_17590 [Cyanobacteria bacterium J06554_6]
MNWIFVGVAALLWPLTTPFIIWKKTTTFLKQRQQPEKRTEPTSPASSLESIHHS